MASSPCVGKHGARRRALPTSDYEKYALPGNPLPCALLDIIHIMRRYRHGRYFPYNFVSHRATEKHRREIFSFLCESLCLCVKQKQCNVRIYVMTGCQKLPLTSLEALKYPLRLGIMFPFRGNLIKGFHDEYSYLDDSGALTCGDV